MFSGLDLNLNLSRDLGHLVACPSNLTTFSGKQLFWLPAFGQIMRPGIRFPRPRYQGIGCKGLQEQFDYQAYEDTAQLDNVGVGDGVEASHPGVEDCDQGRADHRRVQLHVYYHRQCGAWTAPLQQHSSKRDSPRCRRKVYGEEKKHTIQHFQLCLVTTLCSVQLNVWNC